MGFADGFWRESFADGHEGDGGWIATSAAGGVGYSLTNVRNIFRDGHNKEVRIQRSEGRSETNVKFVSLLTFQF